MPSSIASAQASSLNSLASYGTDIGAFELLTVKTEFQKLGADFMQALGKSVNKHNVVASGKLLSDASFKISDDGLTLQIIMPYYFDFPNEGVRGWGSSKNAPGSPYQYKSGGMNASGRASIAAYISSGKAKISNVHTDRAFPYKREKKHATLLETQTETLIYLIKRFGIKRTGYFTEALQEVFKDFELKMTEALGKDIVFTLEKINYDNGKH